MISIVGQCNGIKLCAMRWDSIAHDQISCAIYREAIACVMKGIGIVLLIISIVCNAWNEIAHDNETVVQ